MNALTPKQYEQIDRLLDLALEEDVGTGDVTTEVLTTGASRLQAVYTARDIGVLSGVEIVQRFFRKLSPEVELEPLLTDGAPLEKGARIMKISGPARPVLTGERISLNILQRMCGIATVAHKYAAAVAGTRAKIYDTRKTLPGHRALDKMAVMHGGGCNHRLGLYDMILIKDNHLALAEIASPADAVRTARAKSPLPIMAEVDTLEQLANVLPAAPDYILLDNMPPEVLKKAVAMTDAAFASDPARRPALEASGGINFDSVRAIAESGVDRISIGALTHSVKALDIGLDYLG